ncbi:MAG: long-chain fatty acid--CoA ligase [Acidobacteria bacterium]|nr:long-chain fatty acid--CoA ligase [Acidobacteriota bacterium]
MEFPNIYSLFRAQCEKYGDRPVFYTSSGEAWVPQTWTSFENKVLDLGCALLAKGLTNGGKVAILAGNIPEWTIVDVAAISAGGVGVGIYPTSSPEQAHFIVEHSDAEFLVVENEGQLQTISDTNEPYSKLKEIFIISAIDDVSVELVRKKNSIFLDVAELPVRPLSQVLKYGRQQREKHLPDLDRIGRSAKPDDTAIMVYTSGTTGQPKAAMLSHAYILNSVESLRRSVPIFDSDTSLSYLPGCHVAERISGIYNRLYNGASAYFVDDLSKLYTYMLDVKPTVFASLPRFFEKIHAAVVAQHGENAGPQALKDAFGGNVRLLTSGGAPLPAEIAAFYEERGLPILQAYGLTENIAVAFNTVEQHKFGTVGKPMPMTEVRIASDGEIEVRSPMMFSGYYKAPAETAEMFTNDGWLKTGDLGELDEDGFLKITGRKKEIIVLSSGKNVAPALVENLVKESHLISHCFVHGDGRNYCVALITINADEAANMCPEEIQMRVDEVVAKTNRRVSSSEQIKKFVVLEEDFSLMRDEVTPTMKLKRNVVAANYEEILERLYE